MHYGPQMHRVVRTSRPNLSLRILRAVPTGSYRPLMLRRRSIPARTSLFARSSQRAVSVTEDQMD